MNFRLLLIILLTIFLGCKRQEPDKRLQEVASIVDRSPKTALSRLDSIDYSKLSERDRYFYDFLKVKGTDKAFITHTSDSLILRVIEYYKENDHDGLYPEVVYYAGRVYHDMGDFPTALRYYQKALDLIPFSQSNLKLRASVLAQATSVMYSIRIYEQAIPYVTESLRIDSLLYDHENTVYDEQLLGNIYLNMKKYDLAEYRFSRAAKYSKKEEDKAVQTMYMAAVKYEKGNLDSALYLIRQIIHKVDSIDKHLALAYATKIYYDAHMYDSAVKYAKELISSRNTINHKIGYRILLSPELIKRLPLDSVYSYISTYGKLIEKHLNKNGQSETLIQNSFYNYQNHLKKRQEAEEDNRSLRLILTTISIIFLLGIVVILILKNLSKTRLLKLHKALDEVNTLRRELEHKNEEIVNAQDSGSEETVETASSNDSFENGAEYEHGLQHRLRDELTALSRANKFSSPVSSEITVSDIYGLLRKKINESDPIPERSSIWEELEHVVLRVSPKFKSRLSIMMGGRIKELDYQMALLIKCGFTPTQLSILAGRTKSAIANRRDAMGKKLFGIKTEKNIVDDVIRLL